MTDYEFEEEPYVLYCNRPEFNDLEPVRQDDGENPACAINYSREFEDVMNYFRALIKKDEISQRAFDLTTDAIDFNPANYTVWFYRRKLIAALQIDLKQELAWLSDVIISNHKNYQVWFHRRAIVEMLGDASKEDAFTKRLLAQDTKNYHAWTHRHWVFETFKIDENLKNSGLDYVNDLINLDVRNNSAWNHRFFILHFLPRERSISKSQDEILKLVTSEVDYTVDKIVEVPNNESSWNYLEGMLSFYKFSLMDFPEALQLTTRLATEEPIVPLACDNLLSYYEKQIEGGVHDALPQAIQLCDTLMNLDHVRCNFYQYRKQRLETAST